MRLDDAAKVLKAHYEALVPLMLWGPPGIGKSSIAKDLAKTLGVQFIDFRLPQVEPSDIRGIPVPNKANLTIEWFVPAIFPTDPESEGILFLDEIEKAPMAVKNAALQLVLDRQVGEYELPPKWFVMAAGNREEDGCFSQPIGTALANRMGHVDVKPDWEVWTVWAKENEISDDILAFIAYRGVELLYKMTGQNAFPTPRTWEFASKLIKNTEDPNLRYDLLASTVGPSAATEFKAYNDVYKNIDVDAVFRGVYPTEQLNGRDRSFSYATTMAVAHRLKRRKKGIEGVEEGLAGFLELLPADMRVVFAKQLKISFLETMTHHTAFDGIIDGLLTVCL